MPVLTDSTYSKRTPTNPVTTWIDPSIVGTPTVEDIRERNGLPRVPTTRDRKRDTMPLLTDDTYGAGRGRGSEPATLTDETVAYLLENREPILNGQYVALTESDWSGPKSNVGDVVLQVFELDADEYHVPTRDGKNLKTKGAALEFTVRPMTEARKIRLGIIPDPNADNGEGEDETADES